MSKLAENGQQHLFSRPFLSLLVFGFLNGPGSWLGVFFDRLWTIFLSKADQVLRHSETQLLSVPPPPCIVSTLA